MSTALLGAPIAAAGAFTTNRFAAPPVVVARERLRGGRVQAVLVNTKSANAGTTFRTMIPMSTSIIVIRIAG